MPLNRNLRLSILDGSFYSFMVGLGETYIAAYMIAKGYSAVAASLISTIPLLFGGLFQLLTPIFIHKVGSYKKWVIRSSSLQGLSLIVLATTAYFDVSVYWVFAIVSMYWAGGMSTGPAWNSWMTELVPSNIQVQYFSMRSMISSGFVLAGIISGGFLLHFYQNSEELLGMFFNLFLVAGMCRLISSYFLNMQTETEVSRKTIQSQSLSNVFKTTYGSNQKNLLLFIFIFLFAVHFSSCFFNPFMLKELNLSFMSYMSLLAVSFVAKMFSQFCCHKLVNKLTLDRVFLISTLGIVPLPLVWIFDQNIYYLGAMQFISGFMWGLYEVCIFLILFSTVTAEKRTATLSVYNLLQTTGMVLGSTLGAVLFHNSSHQAYTNVFLVSTFLRFAAIMFFPGFKLHSAKIKSLLVLKPSGERLSRGEAPRIIIDASTKSEDIKTKRSVS